MDLREPIFYFSSFFQMTGSIADGLWSASMDSRIQESRGWMRADRGSSSGDHLLAGFKGLGMGVIGGLTSMVTQPIEGASRRGVQVTHTVVYYSITTG